MLPCLFRHACVHQIWYEWYGYSRRMAYHIPAQEAPRSHVHLPRPEPFAGSACWSHTFLHTPSRRLTTAIPSTEQLQYTLLFPLGAEIAFSLRLTIAHVSPTVSPTSRNVLHTS